MRIILQDPTTHLYWKSQNEWTESKDQALDLPSVVEAEKLCRENNLNVVALAVRGEQIYKLHLDCAHREPRSKARHQ